jgi:hypothetical protein
MENGSTRASWLIDWRSIGVSQSDGTWPQNVIAPLPKEGISYCRIGMIGLLLWPWYLLCLRQVLCALRRLLVWHCTDRLLLFALLYPRGFNRVCYARLDWTGLGWSELTVAQPDATAPPLRLLNNSLSKLS